MERLRARRARSEAGFTLIEVMVALGILAAGLLYFASVALGPHGGMLQLLRQSRRRRARLLESMET